MKSSKKEMGLLASVFISTFGWVLMALVTIFFNVLGILCFPVSCIFDNKRKWIHGLAQMWAKTLIALNPVWQIRIMGSENIAKNETYVIVANHQSILDIIVALAGLPGHFKFMAKQELFAIPFLGWHMTLAGYIPLIRGDKDSGKKAVLKAKDWLHNGVSILFFPEGTRSPDGEIKDYKPGAFRLAQAEKIKVLPVVIDGASSAIPKRSWRVRQHSRFVLSIEKPIELHAFENISGGIENIRGQMAKRLKEFRREA